jgi:hypothetical protein
MGTFHISGMGNQTNEIILNQADLVLNGSSGQIEINPHFDNEYYSNLV